jgi:peptidyl-prolyl cis-trans isomerase SurA
MARFGSTLVVGALVGCLCAAAVELVDGIAAQVGSDVVLVSEVNRLANPIETEMRSAGAPDEEIAKMRAEALERLIERRLIGQVARRAEIDASDAEVDEAIAAIAQENQLSAAALRRSVEEQGLSYEAYRLRIREEIVQQKVLGGMVRAHLRIEEGELERLYRERYSDQRTTGEEVRTRQLLVTFEDDSPEARQASCQTVREALQRIQAGVPFASVASELSRVNPDRGGDLGWLHTDEIARWMAVVLEPLQPGDVSGMVETSFGCSLLQLVERREVRPVTFEEVEPQLRARLLDLKFDEEYRRFMEKLRSQTYIDRKGLFAEAARLSFDEATETSEPPLLP